jgi:hypothetical protein
MTVRARDTDGGATAVRGRTLYQTTKQNDGVLDETRSYKAATLRLCPNGY